jgi:hypothetical protein
MGGGGKERRPASGNYTAFVSELKKGNDGNFT